MRTHRLHARVHAITVGTIAIVMKQVDNSSVTISVSGIDGTRENVMLIRVLQILVFTDEVWRFC